MKVMVLGAAGKAGRAAISFLRFVPGLERIYLADNNAESLCKLSADLAHLPVSPRYLDVDDESSLYERMKEADLVLGCLGPFYRYERTIARAAVASGRDYLSLCDDPGAVEDVLSLGKEAERSGSRILCGCGLAPGLSNLLACRAGSRMDRADSIELAWYLQLGPGLGAATLEHLVHSFAGKAPTLEGGRPASARAGSWEDTVEFPPPVGWQPVYYLSHPEPVTLPGALAGAGSVRFKAGVGSRGKGIAMHSIARLGEGEESELRGLALRAAASGIARRSGGSCLSAVRVTALGAGDGVPVARTLCVVGDYYRLSGMTMVAALAALAEGGWPPGAYPPEKAIDDPRVFAWLRVAGLRILVGEHGDEAGGGESRSLDV